jgi:hypothetical protein
MGQQQILLIVLGVIIVGIAIVVGINLFNASAISSNRDAVINDLSNLAVQAHNYYSKPTSIGGGGNSFVNYTIPTALASTANGTYTIVTAGTATGITFQGVGNQIASGSNYVTAQIFVNVPPLVDSTAVIY